MRTKIIATIFICFYSSLGFSQTRTLLHTFERHLLDKPDLNMNGVMNFYGERKEDYTIRLFSDSTFTITYFYTATGNYYPNYKAYETATGSFYNKDGIIYLIRNNSVFPASLFSLRQINFGTSAPKKLEQMLTLSVPVKIEYSDNSLALYNTGGWSMIFMKRNSLKL
jgi:hypothetical protein